MENQRPKPSPSCPRLTQAHSTNDISCCSPPAHAQRASRSWEGRSTERTTHAQRKVAQKRKKVQMMEWVQ